jgi:signal transduction histidine kinase
MDQGTASPAWDPTSERLIAFVRLGLVVIWFDPTQPAKYWPIAYAAFVLYVVYSALVLQLVRSGPRPRLPLVTQVIDLLWILPVVYFTEAANTPFFVFFVTFTLSAGLRWGSWASWAVMAYSLAVYVVLLFVETPTPLDLNNDLMRLGYLVIVGVLGGYLTEYRRRREQELRTLRAAAEVIGTKYHASAAVGAIVDLARRHALADEVVGVLRDPEDGDPVIIRGDGDVKRLSQDEAAPFFGAIALDADQPGGPAEALSEIGGVILGFADADRGVAYPVRAGQRVVGALFFFDRSPRSRARPVDEFLRLLLRHVIPHIETLYVLEQAPHTRVAEERRRIGRDLHDSFLQVLAALGLRLDVLSASVPATPWAAEQQRRDLAELREIIGREQLRVRAYITEMREPMGGTSALRDSLEEIADALRARTRIAVDVSIAARVPELPAAVRRELVPLLREALANVEKHAHASRVAVSADFDGGSFLLCIRDDGVGLAEAALAGPGMGGRGHGLSSMRERAELLGGRLWLESTPGQGALLTVKIPLTASS